jgi:hypothetical protein
MAGKNDFLSIGQSDDSKPSKDTPRMLTESLEGSGR